MAYKVFTNGSPLPASDLNTFLMNQSVIVFSNSTARSAALTSPTEGMVTYLEDTNKVEVYTGSPLAWTDINDNSAAIPKSTVTTAGDLIVADGNASVTRLGIGANGSIPRVASGSLGYLPIGTDGQVLSVSSGAPTWTTPTGGSTAWTLLNNGTNFPTGATTSRIDLTQNYDKYALFIRGASSSGTNGGISFQVMDDTLTNTLDVDVYVQPQWQGGGSSAFFNVRQGSPGSNSVLAGEVSAASSSLSGYISLVGASKAGKMFCQFGFAPSGDGAGNYATGGGVIFNIPNGRKVGAIRISTNSGNIDAGALHAYGA